MDSKLCKFLLPSLHEINRHVTLHPQRHFEVYLDDISNSERVLVFSHLAFFSSLLEAGISPSTASSTLNFQKMRMTIAQSSTKLNRFPRQPRLPAENGMNDPVLERRRFPVSFPLRSSQFRGLKAATGYGFVSGRHP